ncbi:hypothetical protein [Pseudorhodobacter sp. MZDSW-24AT]|uniref:hypothetical protein n=1 Tax=Pseudorhodobacter sp. MZDSW-24AT TaxID=2052957 RepID=UPI0012FD254D|nr:hypothetical protein [Pseudorhodobacter sp. MZDSW-24AT]
MIFHEETQFIYGVTEGTSSFLTFRAAARTRESSWHPGAEQHLPEQPPPPQSLKGFC